MDWVSRGFPVRGISPLSFDCLPVHDPLIHVDTSSDDDVRLFALIENDQKKASIPAGRVMGISTA
nr:hypothetical protein [Synechococcus sp. AH-551-C10]